VLVEREIGDETLQAGILVLDLPDTPHLVDAEVRKALLPDVERRLADAGLAADVDNRRARVGLPDRVGAPPISSPLHRPPVLA
jgi:hypothetical protein